MLPPFFAFVMRCRRFPLLEWETMAGADCAHGGSESGSELALTVFVKGEGVGQMSDLGHLVVGQDHFDDIDADANRGFVDGAEIVKDGLGDEASFASVDCGGGSQPLADGPGLHFNEGETLGIFENEIDLPATTPIIGGEEAQSGRFQMLACHLFTELSPLEVDGEVRFGSKPAPEPGNDHGNRAG